MLDKLKALVTVAEDMVTKEDRVVMGVTLEVEEELGGVGVVCIQIQEQDKVTQYSEPFEWKEGKWISLLPVEFGVPDGLPY
jgi:hypothetical protein